MKDGDYWLDSSTNSLQVWSIVGPAWQAPRLADLHFVGSSIVAPAATDLTLSLDVGHYVDISSGTSGPALITASGGQDLHINPATGGGQYLFLNANKWPTADGTANQVLTTNGSGTLSFAAVSSIGTAAPSTTATTGFAYIPVMTGTPTGTPTTISGFAPMVADSGGTKLWVYIGGAWKSTTLT
jgi:hypothetical protein